MVYIVIGILIISLLVVVKLARMEDTIPLNFLGRVIFAQVAGILVCVFCGIYLLGVPMAKNANRVLIVQKQQTQAIINLSQKGSMENAALMAKIIDMNNRIAGEKYARTVFVLKPFTIPEIDTLQYLKLPK